MVTRDPWADERALDLFAGPGGWSVACAELGIGEFGVEWDREAARTAVLAGHHRHVGDVRRFEPNANEFDGVIASPPCQTFSRAGRGSGRDALDDLLATVPLVAAGADPSDALADIAGVYIDEWPLGIAFDTPVVHDERSVLVLEPLRVIRQTMPTWVALEQVPSVLPLWNAYAVELTLLGYHAWTGILTAEAYGVPQTRRRAILIASRTRQVRTPRQTHSRYHAGDPARIDPGLPRWVSMAEALSWGMTERPYVTVAAGTASGGTDPQALGGSAARATVQREVDAGRWRPKFRDLSGSPFDPTWPEHRPSTTVQGRDTIAHPGQTRNATNASSKSRNDGVRVTVAEAGILQGFPRAYPWAGGRTSKFQQIGDAIPPPFAAAILREATGLP